jgi:hypothetical protein
VVRAWSCSGTASVGKGNVLTEGKGSYAGLSCITEWWLMLPVVGAVTRVVCIAGGVSSAGTDGTGRISNLGPEAEGEWDDSAGC